MGITVTVTVTFELVHDLSVKVTRSVNSYKDRPSLIEIVGHVMMCSHQKSGFADVTSHKDLNTVYDLRESVDVRATSRSSWK